MTFAQVYIAAVIIIAMLMVILIVHEIGKRAGVKMERERLKVFTDNTTKENRDLYQKNLALEQEIERLKEQNVSRGTSSYNQSFGDPEVKMWLDQQYLEGEHK